VCVCVHTHTMTHGVYINVGHHHALRRQQVGLADIDDLSAIASGLLSPARACVCPAASVPVARTRGDT